MNKQLGLLIELQGLDSAMLSARLKIDAIPDKISSYEIPLKTAQNAHKKAKQYLVSLEKKKRDKEREIDEVNEKINKLHQRTSAIKTNKEYQAHIKEIEKIKKELDAAEDELLATLDSLEISSKLLKTEGDHLAKEKGEIDVIKKELDKEVIQCEEELEKLKENRKKLVDKIEIDIYTQYMDILRVSRGTAVVEAMNEICHGCNLHIPPRLFVEVKTTDEIICCPQCKRMLYYVKQKKAEE